MNKLSLIYLGSFFLITSLISFLNILYCYYFKIYFSLDAFVYLLLISLTISFILFVQEKKSTKPNIFEKILFVISGYLFYSLNFFGSVLFW